MKDMRFVNTADGVVLKVYVKPNSKRFRVEVEGDEVVMSCHEAPVKGRVNRELVKKLSGLFNRKVEFISGFGSRYKKVLVRNIEVAEVNRILSSLSASEFP